MHDLTDQGEEHDVHGVGLETAVPRVGGGWAKVLREIKFIHKIVRRRAKSW